VEKVLPIMLEAYLRAGPLSRLAPMRHWKQAGLHKAWDHALLLLAERLEPLLDQWDNAALPYETRARALLAATLDYINMPGVDLVGASNLRPFRQKAVVEFPERSPFIIDMEDDTHGDQEDIWMRPPAGSLPQSDDLRAGGDATAKSAARKSRNFRPKSCTNTVNGHGAAPRDEVSADGADDLHPNHHEDIMLPPAYVPTAAKPSTQRSTRACVDMLAKKAGVDECSNGPYGWSHDKLARVRTRPDGRTHPGMLQIGRLMSVLTVNYTLPRAVSFAVSAR
jgi:hypothetical protein